MALRTLFLWLGSRLPAITFCLSLAIVIFVYGYFVGRDQIFPHSFLRAAKVAAKELWRWAELYVPSGREEDHPHVILWTEPDSQSDSSSSATDDFTFITGYRPGGFSLFLVDSTGASQYEWQIPEAALDRVQTEDQWAIPKSNYNVMGAYLYPNGDVAFNIQFKALVKIDRCSRLLWYLSTSAHHSIFVDEEGFLWVPGSRTIKQESQDYPHMTWPVSEDLVLKVSPDGQIAEQFSVLKAAFDGGFQGVVMEGPPEYPNSSTEDPLHLNEIELVPEEFARRHAFVEKGDILVSLRTVDTIAFIDKDTHVMKYALTGNMLRQHDPDLLDNGNILVFDNRTDRGQRNEARYLTERPAFGYSRVVEIDPLTQQIVWSYEGSEAEPFYTSIQGSAEKLDNGNVLIVESEGGRVFEVDYETKDIVWQYRNRIGASERGTLLGRVTGAARYKSRELPFLGSRCE